MAIDTFRFIDWSINTPQMQFLVPSSKVAYETWARTTDNKEVTEDLTDAGGARLFWVGKKRREGKVILFVHGGALFAPLVSYQIKLSAFIQAQIQSSETPVGLTMLDYSLFPEAVFPIQTRQVMLAVEHLLDSGIHPSDLYLMGDSAGGLLVLSFLAHVLRPMDAQYLRASTLSNLNAQLGGVYLMSPWAQMGVSAGGSFEENKGKDIIFSRNLEEWTSHALRDVPDELIPYIDIASSSPGTFTDLGKVVKRMLVSAGGDELLRDYIVEFAQRLREESGMGDDNFGLIVQEGGTHDDPILDFAIDSPTRPEDLRSSLTMQVVEWFDHGFLGRQ